MIVKKPTNSRNLVFGLLLAALVSAMLLAAKPAHAATFTVNSTGDDGDQSPGNGSCATGSFIVGVGTECTLRAAIQEANATAGADTISFDIPGSGVKTISPTSKLPTISDAVTVDGYTQSGASPNTLAVGTNAVLKIELNGESAGAADGLRIEGLTTSNSVIKGLAINSFGRGITTSSSSTRVEGNFIGTDASGTQDLGNRQEGILVGSGGDHIIGGTAPAARNLISGNGSGSIGDTPGIHLATGEGKNLVLGNLIGTGKDGSTPMGNSGDGVFIHGTLGDNTVGGPASGAANIIAFNGRDGVSVDEFSGEFVPVRDRILNNSIFSNGDLGIDLNDDGVTPNDPGDSDTGPNNLQNYPVLTQAFDFLDRTLIQGGLNSTPNTTFTVQFFSSSVADPSGFGEGEKFLGQTSVTTDASGNALVNFATPSGQQVPSGERITATATSSSGDTSEFSRAVTVNNRAPVASDDSYGVKEDTTLSVPNGPTDVLANDSDPDGDLLTAVKVSDPANGTLTLNENGSFTYKSNADFNGSDSFTYKATDGTAESNTATVSITVNPVNDAPSFTKGPDQAVSEDSGAQTVPGWATGISAGPADESGQNVSFLVTNNNNALFSAQPAVSPDGTLTFTPAANQSGTATVSVRIKDDGGTANGGADTSAPQSFTIFVTSINDPPTITPISPKPNSRIKDRTPTVRARVSDLETDLARTNIKLFLDGRKRGTFSYDRATDLLSFQSPRLSFGRHTVKVVATDAQGGSATKQWVFRVIR